MPPRRPHRLLVGPHFLTGVGAGAFRAEAVEVDGLGRVVALHERCPGLRARAGAELVRIPGSVAVPGLHDAHVHPGPLGAETSRADLRDVEGPAEVRERVRRFARARPEEPVLWGFGWDAGRFPAQREPTWRDLEGLTDRPVALGRADGHALWVNRVALERSGVTSATPDPPGGRVERAADGAPTGILVDRARELVEPATGRSEPGDRARWLEAGLARCADAGLVAVHAMSVEADELEHLEALAAADALPLRVLAYVDDHTPGLAESAGGRTDPTGAGELHVVGAKRFVDGALGSRGAALLAPYADAPHERGLLRTSVRELRDRLRELHEGGCPVALHAIGDRAVRRALDAVEVARRARALAHLRHRVEHAQLVELVDRRRFAPLGVVASIQPSQLVTDRRWLRARLGAERARRAHPWRALGAAGAPLALGTDAPIEPVDPRLGLRVVRTNRAPDGRRLRDPGEELSAAAALDAATRGAARAAGREADLGSLLPGKRADLTLLDDVGDVRCDARIAGTVVGGRVRPVPGRGNGGSDATP